MATRFSNCFLTKPAFSAPNSFSEYKEIGSDTFFLTSNEFFEVPKIRRQHTFFINAIECILITNFDFFIELFTKTTVEKKYLSFFPRIIFELDLDFDQLLSLSCQQNSVILLSSRPSRSRAASSIAQQQQLIIPTWSVNA